MTILNLGWPVCGSLDGRRGDGAHTLYREVVNYPIVCLYIYSRTGCIAPHTYLYIIFIPIKIRSACLYIKRINIYIRARVCVYSAEQTADIVRDAEYKTLVLG